ncbi:MAG: hypothetical protein HQ541_13790 [Mariniphaga sp.]|nr:hypothetical protein [Mariniphaga sp.]
MQKIAKYLSENITDVSKGNINKDIIFQISQLNRQHRSELRDHIFEYSKQQSSEPDQVDIINWLKQCFHLIDKYSFRFNKVFFSPGPEIKNAIFQLLNEAQSSVYLCVFTITDSKLANEIINCHKRGVKVKIITDDQKTEAKGSEIFAMENAGIPIKTDHSKYHMHNKFGIIDGRIALTGSFNWTYTATKHN